MSTFSGLAGGSIKSIQRGVITIPHGLYSATATISTVDPGKSELRLLGVDGLAGIGALLVPFLARLQLSDSATVSASSSTAATSGATYISWELTEWN